MAPSIVPVAKAIYLCDFHIGYTGGKTDLCGLFNALRPSHGYPYVCERFCIFAQLNNGLGRIPFYVDIRHAATSELIRSTVPQELYFPDRNTLLQVAITIRSCRFPRAGLYLVELFCDNTWVCDTQLLLR